MIGTGIEKRIQVQQVIESQLPEYILSESPKTVDFLKQYYISQEHRGGVIDLSDNLDQYIKLDNLTPEVIVGVTTLSAGITTTSDTITVSSTKGFPNEYGLLKIDNEGYPIQPYGYKNNPYSILDVADIVFVNPVNTAYSRILEIDGKKAEREQFFGINYF